VPSSAPMWAIHSAARPVSHARLFDRGDRVADYNPKEVHIYDLVDGAWTRTLRLQNVNNYAVRLSPDGRHLAVGDAYLAKRAAGRGGGRASSPSLGFNGSRSSLSALARRREATSTDTSSELSKDVSCFQRASAKSEMHIVGKTRKGSMGSRLANASWSGWASLAISASSCDGTDASPSEELRSLAVLPGGGRGTGHLKSGLSFSKVTLSEFVLDGTEICASGIP
jgi:hypothetical protein